MAVPVRKNHRTGKLVVIEGGKRKKLRRDGQPKQTKSGAEKGKSNEVYPIKSKQKIEEIKVVLKKRIDAAEDFRHAKIAARNYLLFVFGINIGLRASDLLNLKYKNVIDSDGEFIKGYKIQPRKTRNKGKFVTLHYVLPIREAITWYKEYFDSEAKLDDYIFISSQEKNMPICRKTAENIIKGAGKEVGLKVNLGTHTLRKTFGYWHYTCSKDSGKALTYLQLIFNHADQSTTLRYIGIQDEEIEDFYNEVTL